jgi:two-component system, sensor histidine kinase
MRLRILVVDDHPPAVQVLVRLLRQWGFDVAIAETLQNGLQLLDSAFFDIIVSDIALPDGTGYALVGEAKRRRKDVLAIAVSGYCSPADRKISRLAGFDYHLAKPCDCERLRSILDEPRSMKPQSGAFLAPADLSRDY